MSAPKTLARSKRTDAGELARPAGETLHLEVLLTPAELAGCNVKGRSLVVIDVLRMCTTACYALYHGAERLIPVGSIEEATRLGASLDRAVTLLCGEREGERIEGFHLGNSPREYTREVVGGKTLILTTSNGTRTAEQAEGAREIALAGLVNISAVARWVSKREGPVLVVCSGNLGRFALEDAVAAGLLVQRVEALASQALDLDDGAGASRALAAAHPGDLGKMLARCENGRNLVQRGHGEDLPICAGLDRLATVPVIREGRILGAGSRESEGWE